jgi:UDP-N-acetyl-2-amino-2-deoxyglucuronate dehydrogenase
MVNDGSDGSGRNRLRFGIAGCGGIGPTHVAALGQIAAADVVAVADPIADRAAKVEKQFGVEKVYGDIAELLADSNVDAVCICTPSGMHGDHAVAAMEAGKHVVVEKPMEVTLEACDRMLAAQRATGRTMAVISQHRFDPATIEVRRMIDSGLLGKLVLVTADVKWWRTQGYYDEGDWRGTFALDGGGAVMNQGIHTVDLLLHLAGDVSTVSALVATAAHERIEVEDAAAATIRFKSGAVGSFVASTAAFDGLPVRIDLFGTEGACSIEGDRLAWTKFKSGGGKTGDAPASHAVGVASGGTAGVTASTDALAWGDSHRAQLADFIDAVRTGRPPGVDGIAGRAAVRLVRAIYAAAAGGVTVSVEAGAGAVVSGVESVVSG